MLATCPAITLVGETSVSGSLTALDCNIAQAVETGYERLFGAGGAFASSLTAGLTIYVALLAYGFITGRTRLTMSMMSPRLMTMVLVLTFVTVWPAYHTVFYGLFMGGPDEVAGALLGLKGGSAVSHFAEGLDAFFVHFSSVAKSFETETDQATSIMLSKSMPVTLFWLSGLILILFTLGVLILSKLVLYLMLILGPVFIAFALFNQTRGLFNGWLKTSLVFALAPMLTVLGGSGALMLFVPLINAISADPEGAVKSVQPMLILFFGSLIYAAFMMTLMWVAANLVKYWQATLRDPPQAAPSLEPQSLSMMNQGMAAQAMMMSLQAMGSTGSGSNEGSRGAQGYDARTQILVRDVPSSTAGGALGSERSRTQGLGQRFRASPSAHQGFTGAKPQTAQLPKTDPSPPVSGEDNVQA